MSDLFLRRLKFNLEALSTKFGLLYEFDSYEESCITLTIRDDKIGTMQCTRKSDLEIMSIIIGPPLTLKDLKMILI